MPVFKTCRRCDRQLGIGSFYPHSRMKDGFLNVCKQCVKERVKEHRRNNRDRITEYDKKRSVLPERKKQRLEITRKERKTHPDRYKARTAVNNAIRDGRLKRKACKYCGAKKVQAHHHDYSKPLDVVWLCFKCHREKEHGQVTTKNF